ncbi:unnamed protein product [Amoebophrya sp. A120]|nr:unnamed protein product [Amoebophrya sp. A120]|eukprot:GSA120T00019913001.1
MCYDCSAAVDDTITEVTAELQCTKGTGDKCKFDQDDKCVAAAVDGTPPPEAGPTCTSEEHTGKLCIQTAGQYCETIAPSAPLPAFADGDTCSRKTPYNGTGITWTTPLDWQALHRNVNWYWKADLCRADCQNDANCAWYTTIHGGTLVDDTGADWQNQDHKNCEEVEWIKATTGEFAGLWSPNSALLTTGKTACTWKYDCILFNACPVLEEF